MAETFADQDLMTLQSIARGAGIPDTERMPHDELVDMLRRAGLAEPDGRPVDTSIADPGDPGTDAGVYHARGAGRRESAGGVGAQTGWPDQPTRDPAHLAGLPRSSLTLGDESTGGRAAQEAIGARPGETRIEDRSRDVGRVQGEVRDPADLAGLPRSSLTLGDESTGGVAAEEAIGARPGESDTEIDDRSRG
ncbi:hypothetical protein GA0074704_3429 [Micromonospora siamensis]|uniref:Uncharacterized protein n=1 Tax=Micromonospora siamensis TaxID=299152 RepID=A0A1C5IHF9_9ACTN|nr:hypothetical protein GA0074704_3429 [Micromonospora siamensis]